MSEPTGEIQQPVVQEPVNTGPTTEPEQTGDNPAWADFLNIIPSGLHDPVKQRLSEWDKGVNERFQKVHSEYEPYKWAKEGKIDGTELQNAYGFFQTANNNPREVWEFLGQQYGFANAPQQGQQANTPNPNDQVDLSEYDGDGSPFDIENHPTVKALREQQAKFDAYVEQQEQQRANDEANRWTQAVTERLSKSHPDVDMDRVWAQAAGMIGANPNVDPDKLVTDIATREQQYIDSVRSRPAPGASAPTVMSPTGGSPVAPGIAQMSETDRKAAAVAFLNAANSSNA